MVKAVAPEKVLSPIWFIPAGITTASRLEFKNAPVPMSVIDSGNSIAVMAVLAKAELPILATELPKVISAKEVAPEKAKFPIWVTESGITTEVKDVL